MRETIDTTYADLRPTDLVIDKSGQAWPLDDEIETSLDGTSTIFWLCDPMTGIRLHNLTKPVNDAVKVSRLPAQADEASKLEADFPKSSAPATEVSGTGAPTTETMTTSTTQDSDPMLPPSGGDNYATTAEAVAAVEEIGGTVEAEVTAAEVDAAAAATDDAPASQPPFADMTPLEQRSHLYLLHGLYGSDVTGKAELIAIHDQAHAQHDAGSLNSRHVPHVHTGNL